ncbi:NusA-like transcription termination signal-binding factor [Candidatus Hodarchaeum mangrovi]
MSNIRMSQEELQFISKLEGFTGALAVDCIWDKEGSRVIFVVKRHDTGKVIGRGGTTIRRLREYFQKQIDIVEYSNKLEDFVSNTLAPAKTKSVEILKRAGEKVVVVTVVSKEKGKAIGKNGRNIHRSRLLLKRHFGIDHVELREAT